MSKSAGKLVFYPVSIPSTELLAGTAMEFVAPMDGVIEELVSTVQTAVTTGGTLAVNTGDALATTVLGLTQTIADAAAKGARQTTESTEGSSTRVVTKGTRCAITPSAGFATAGAVECLVVFRSIDLSPSLPAAALPALG